MSADLLRTPAPFVDAGRKMVFVDFVEAHYEIIIDVATQKATAKTLVDFLQPIQGVSPGHPLFDLLPEVTSALLDGAPVTVVDVESPSGKGIYRCLSEPIAPGPHRLEIAHSLDGVVVFSGGTARLHFDFSDLEERGFLEQYLPTSFEYDHYAMSLEIQILNAVEPYKLFANGEITSPEQNKWSVKFPSYFNCSCPYVDVLLATEVFERQFDYARAGETLPVTLYGSRDFNDTQIQEMQDLVTAALATLEGDFGPFPHPRLLVNLNFGNNMEYAGAITSKAHKETVCHELNHNYFARCILPADGNAGWMDEAIASWYELEHLPLTELEPDSANLCNRSVYLRRTDGGSNSVGVEFLRHLDFLLTAKGGLRAFLRAYFEQRQRQSVSAQDFRRLIELHFGQALPDALWAKISTSG